MASSTASETRFSEGINSNPVACLRASSRNSSAICGSTTSSGRFMRSFSLVVGLIITPARRKIAAEILSDRAAPRKPGLILSALAVFRLQQRAMQNQQGHGKINAQSGHIHERGYKWSRTCRRVESQSTQNKRQHAACQRSEHHHANQASPYRKGQQQIMCAVIRKMQMLPQHNAKKTNHAQHEPQRES